MRWPIRNQILLPFLMIQTVTVIAVVVSSAWIAVRQVERDIERRLENVLVTLEAATYPLTPKILNQLNQLSGAEFVVYDQSGALEADNLSGFDRSKFDAIRTQFELLEQGLIDASSIVEIEGQRYFAGFVKRSYGLGQGLVFVLFPEQSWVVARSQAMFPPLLIGCVCLFLTMLASLWIARQVASRIQSVELHVSRIAGGDFTPVPPTRVNDELKDLSTGVNRMAHALENSMHSIRDNERSALLTQLVGSLAHQLRNSLTGARTSVQLHQRHCSLEHDEALEVALRQLTLTEQQIKSLLRLAKGESAPPLPALVGDVLDETAALIMPLCAHHKIQFEYQRSDGLPEIADSDAIRGAILNLVMNAIDAVGISGRVGVSARLDQTQIVIEISDDGPGVPDELLDEIFMPFFTTKQEGAGLGLALARRAAEDCGGTLDYHRR
ncbi:MAG TPA: HAMP domain-containing sensor histidine kinase, partial [Planctomycetaceae bacterium]|nr:HAMP domain-containing sensor histidine kinase [Planctomycetaceae bacterium]